SSPPASGWSTSRASGAAPSSERVGASPSTTPSRSRGEPWCRSENGATSHRSPVPLDSGSARYCGAVITAIVFVKADVARIPEVAEAIAALEGVSEVYSVTGQIDLIALVRVHDHDAVAATVADRLNKVAGVLSTETHIAFRT